jgi:DNA-binding response OmpR family regulator
MDTIPARSAFLSGENATQGPATQERSIGCSFWFGFGHQSAVAPMMKEQVRLEGLLFSSDAQVLGVMNQLLESFTIRTEVCGEFDAALEAVTHRRLDAVIVDWNSVRDPNLLVRAARKSSPNSNSTIVAMVDQGSEAYALLAGANFMINKPTDVDHAQRCMRAAYGTMLQNRRRFARVAVDLPMVLRVIEGERHEARISDISIGGIAVRSETSLQIDQKVTALFTLPRTAELIYLSGAVVNADGKGRAGIRFSFIPDEDLARLQTWLAGELIKQENAGLPSAVARNEHSNISTESTERTEFSTSPPPNKSLFVM